MEIEIDRKITEDRVSMAGRTSAWLDIELGRKTENPYHTNTQEYRVWQRAYRGTTMRLLIFLIIGCVLLLAVIAVLANILVM